MTLVDFKQPQDTSYDEIPSLYFFVSNKPHPELKQVSAIYNLDKASSFEVDKQPILPLFKDFLVMHVARSIPADKNGKAKLMTERGAIRDLCQGALNNGLETLDDLARQINEEQREYLLSKASSCICSGAFSLSCCEKEGVAIPPSQRLLAVGRTRQP